MTSSDNIGDHLALVVDIDGEDAMAIRRAEASMGKPTRRQKAPSGGAGRARTFDLASLNGVQLAAHCSAILDRRSNWYSSEQARVGTPRRPPTLEPPPFRPMAAKASAEPKSRTLDSGIESLSPRELEVLTAAASGGDRRAIGKSLCISEKTVANHLARVYAKLGVTNRTSAIVAAMKSGALDTGGSRVSELPAEKICEQDATLTASPDQAQLGDADTRQRIIAQQDVVAGLQQEEAALRAAVARLRKDKIAVQLACADPFTDTLSGVKALPILPFPCREAARDSLSGSREAIRAQDAAQHPPS